MALIVANINLDNGIMLPSAYVRIDTVSGFKGGLDISVNYYVDQNYFTGDKGYVKQETYNFIPSVEDGSLNFIKQGYEYLKNLPEFTGAIDI